jgi:hypothetical protein
LARAVVRGAEKFAFEFRNDGPAIAPFHPDAGRYALNLPGIPACPFASHGGSE